MSAQAETLSDRAYERLEEMIVTLELSPGEVVSESELSRRIDIGRTPLREALQRLATDRLVDVLPRKGIRIAEIDLHEYLTLLETRRVLDRLVAKRAAQRAEPPDRKALDACAAAMHEAAEEGRLDAFIRLDREFDSVVMEMAANPFAAEALAPLHAHCRRFWYKFRAGGDLKRSASLHQELLRAIVDGEADTAADASDALVDYLAEFTRETLRLR